MRVASYALLILTLSMAASVARAHHAFGAEFDPNRPVQLKGPIVKVEWINPHSWFHVESTGADGSKEVWMVEAGTPNTLVRRGIKRTSIKPGTIVVIDGFQSLDGTKRANGRRMTLANGETLFMGSSGTGAPEDGADKADSKSGDSKSADKQP